MKIEGDRPIEGAGEYAVDFTVVQLVETAPSFRRWFIRRATSHTSIEEYIGATVHATYAGEGESDIEFGVVTGAGDRHLVLIENKIDAAKQPNQFERYYNRGRFRTMRENWDSFSVCLLAPEHYISEADEESVDAVILYQDVIDQLEGLTHDSAAFFQSVFESAMQKTVIADASDTLQAISERVQKRCDAGQLEPVQGRKKSLVFKSMHPEHHDAIGYNVYIVEKGSGGRTKIRLKIRSTDGLTEQERDAIKSIVSEHGDSLSGYEWKLNRKEDIGAKTIWHDEVSQDGMDESYLETVVDELAELVATFHPVFVDRSPK